MTRDVAVRSETRPTRRWGDWFDWTDRPFGDLFRMFDEWRPAGMIGTEDRIRVEEEMRDHTLVVRAEIPGIDPEKDAEVEVTDGMLRIHAERRKEEREEKEGRVRSEFRYGSFSRTIPLPPEVKPDDVTASYKDGILEVLVPMPEHEEKGAKKVSIGRG